MIDTTRTHRCIDCPLHIEHTPGELCGSCGRCAMHCQEMARGGAFVELSNQKALELREGEGVVR